MAERIDFARLLAIVPTDPDWRLDWPVIQSLWPELQALDACPQDALHHAEGDVGTHTRMVPPIVTQVRTWLYHGILGQNINLHSLSLVFKFLV